jgi:superfamily II DNA or RNA helicase
MERPDLILHGTWLLPRHQLALWGEVAAPPTRKGGRRKLPPHPFQALPDALRNRLRDLVLLGDPDALEDFTATLWLPTAGNAPVPSPEMLATGVIPPPADPPTLAPWQVRGLLLPPLAALDLLLALTPAHSIGDDLRVWRLAALLALDLLARQQVVPTLQRDGFTLRATWQPRPSPATVEQLITLTRSLPPLSRALTDDPAQAPSPRALLDDFLTTLVDATVRDLPTRPAFDAATPGGRWLTALLGDDPRVNLTGADATALYDGWQTWVRQGQGAGSDSVRVTFRLEPPSTPDGPWGVAYLVQATDDPSLLVPAALVWREPERLAALDLHVAHPQERLLRGLGVAARIFPPLEPSLRTPTPHQALLSAQDAWLFLREAVPLLEQMGFGVLVPAWWQGGGLRLKLRARASTGPSKTNEQAALSLKQMLAFQWQLAVGNTTLTLEEFEHLVALKQPLVQVRGQWVAVDPDQVPSLLRFFTQQDGQMTFGEVVRVALGHPVDGLPPGLEVEALEADGWLGEVLRSLRERHPMTLLDAPTGLHATLRPYQQRGFSWLGFMQQIGLGACLADDMGLGKTIQTIALLLHQRERQHVTEPALIVSPTSVMGNWQREVERFAPSLRVLMHQGPDRAQGEAFHEALGAYDVVLTSYPLLLRDRDPLTAVTWSAVVLDEAQNIKNAAARQTQAARALQATTRLALTGTPVENRLSELWSLMTFLNPGYLGSERSFQREFARPIERTGDPQATARLKQFTAPFILRRLKTDPSIIADLPDKLEMKAYCSLTAEQVTLYEATVRDGLAQVQEVEQQDDPTKRRGVVLALLMKLKQICNHPALFLKDEGSLPDRSGKVERLTELREAITATKDRVLIFTQFAEMGRMLQAYLEERFLEPVLFLHGGTPAKQRPAMVRQFQAPRGPTVFILSLKAGGTGLNLTAANQVVHFDRWWNPAVENQATDRAFRIGQTRNVQVHTFICGGTLEEHIDQLIEKKRELAANVLGSGEGWLTELSSDQLRDLVKLRR